MSLTWEGIITGVAWLARTYVLSEPLITHLDLIFDHVSVEMFDVSLF